MWGNRKIAGYTGDPGQRGARASAVAQAKRVKKMNEELNKIFQDLQDFINPPPRSGPGRV